MALDPQVHAFLEQVAAHQEDNPAPPITEQSPEMARAGYLAFVEDVVGEGPAVDRVEELQIPALAGTIPARLYRPASPHGLLVFFHGGGFVTGDLNTHDHACRSLCSDAGCSVLSVDYRLAPEHPFPAAVDDSWAALGWAVENVDELASAGAKVAVGGDSSGGNLAAVVALLARDRGGPALAFQLLIYPVVDMRFGHPSISEFAEGYLLIRDDLFWCRDHYLGDQNPSTPHASPLLAESHADLPPTLIITAECDPLHDEGVAYAEKLKSAGVTTTLSDYDGQVHVFFQLSPIFDGGKKALEEACAALRSALA